MQLKLLFLAGVNLLLVALIACTLPKPITPTTPTASSTVEEISSPQSRASITGIVLDETGAPLAGATVRAQTTTIEMVSDENGYFNLYGKVGMPVTISAWADGYYCAKTENVVFPASGITFTMRLVQTNDNPDYEWIPPTGENSCYSCKPGVTQVWLDNDAHGRSAINFRFLTMYNGTDVDGNQSPLTRYAYNKDYGYFPLHPDLTQPYYGPGYKLDFPDTAGNCAACHVPGAAVDAPYGTDPNTGSDTDLFGIHCDYCHKVADVTLNPDTQLPFPNMPGVLSQDIRRPFTENPDRYQLFFGSFDDDNVPEEDTYLPLIKESQWCAPCHYGIFWDTLIYNSYGEWLESSYSDPETGRTCQHCHMPAPTILNDQELTNVAPNNGGVERNPMTIPAHIFPGAANEDLLQNSVTMTVTAARSGDELTVDVTILNDRTGHSIPTDSPLRHMILLVQAVGLDGDSLVLVDGPTLPDWTGIGDPQDGYFAGQPGQAYAKILMEQWTEISPTGSYWNPTRILSDNRIPAMGSDTTHYVFQTPENSNLHVEVRLLYRRAFIELAEQKGWDDPDILMETAQYDLTEASSVTSP